MDILNEVNTVLLREEHTLPEPAYGHRAGQAGNVSHSVCWTHMAGGRCMGIYIPRASVLASVVLGLPFQELLHSLLRVEEHKPIDR